MLMARAPCGGAGRRRRRLPVPGARLDRRPRLPRKAGSSLPLPQRRSRPDKHGLGGRPSGVPGGGQRGRVPHPLRAGGPRGAGPRAGGQAGRDQRRGRAPLGLQLPERPAARGPGPPAVAGGGRPHGARLLPRDGAGRSQPLPAAAAAPRGLPGRGLPPAAPSARLRPRRRGPGARRRRRRPRRGRHGRAAAGRRPGLGLHHPGNRPGRGPGQQRSHHSFLCEAQEAQSLQAFPPGPRHAPRPEPGARAFGLRRLGRLGLRLLGGQLRPRQPGRPHPPRPPQPSSPLGRPSLGAEAQQAQPVNELAAEPTASTQTSLHPGGEGRCRGRGQPSLERGSQLSKREPPPFQPALRRTDLLLYFAVATPAEPQPASGQCSEKNPVKKQNRLTTVQCIKFSLDVVYTKPDVSSWSQSASFQKSLLGRVTCRGGRAASLCFVQKPQVRRADNLMTYLWRPELPSARPGHPSGPRAAASPAKGTRAPAWGEFFYLKRQICCRDF